MEKETNVGNVFTRIWNKVVDYAAADKKPDQDNLVEKKNSNTKEYLEQVERETNMTFPSRDVLDALKDSERN